MMLAQTWCIEVGSRADLKNLLGGEHIWQYSVAPPGVPGPQRSIRNAIPFRKFRGSMPSTHKKEPGRRHALAISSYPLPPPEAVSEMRKKLFSNRFVDEHLSALLGRASYAISEEFHEDTRRYRMPIPHWRILACLYDNEGLSLSELSDL